MSAGLLFEDHGQVVRSHDHWQQTIIITTAVSTNEEIPEQSTEYTAGSLEG
jgi:hypothetical protein